MLLRRTLVLLAGMLRHTDLFTNFRHIESAFLISKKHFCLGGMSASEWMRSVRAVRDTSVVEYSVSGINTTHRIVHHPLRAVSPFHLTLSVSYLKEHSGVVANCDHSSEWVHLVHACIGIAMYWVILRKSLHVFLLPAHKMQFSLY